MSGSLHLIPVGLGEAAPESWLPADARARAGSLDTYIAENAKTARAFLKPVSYTHLHWARSAAVPGRRANCGPY